MKRRSIALWLLLLLSNATLLAAENWQFGNPIPIGGAIPSKVFHHLESSGRRNIAVTEKRVAVVWEDDRDGTPRIYLATKTVADEQFGEPVLVSGDDEAYEPTIASFEDGRFVVAWEEAGHAYLRVIDGDDMGPMAALSPSESSQVSVITHGNRLLAVASERRQRFGQIHLYEFSVGDDRRIQPVRQCVVDSSPLKEAQLYPVIARQQQSVVVAWEDRRPGHTIIMSSHAALSEPCRFSSPTRISQEPAGAGKMPYGKGHGVARVAMAPFGTDRILAAWADKRNFREGYDIYGSTWQSASGFGDNQRIQDDFGGVARQWHAAVAGHADGSVVVAWSDERDGDSNIFMSSLEPDGWSEDVMLPGADGSGEQTHPTLLFDESGNLHVAWIHRAKVGAPTRLYYAFGQKR